MKQLALSIGLASVASIAWADQPTLNPHLQILEPLLGKTWKGPFSNSQREKPMVDIARWERALNGQAVRMVHSVNDGIYGGETLFVWNEKKQAVEFYYFTTAGFMTTGTLELKEGKFITKEEVKGATEGVTAVRGTSEIRPDGGFHVKAEYLKNGEWTLGHEITYREDAASAVLFK